MRTQAGLSPCQRTMLINKARRPNSPQARGQRQAGESACDLAQGGRRDSLLSDRILHGKAFWLRMLDIEENAADVKTDPLLEVALQSRYISTATLGPWPRGMSLVVRTFAICEQRSARYSRPIKLSIRQEVQVLLTGAFKPQECLQSRPNRLTGGATCWRPGSSQGRLDGKEGYGVRRSSMRMKRCVNVPRF